MSTINVDNINPASQSQVAIGPLNLIGTVETGTFTASAVLNVEVNGVPYKLLLATTPPTSFMFTVNTAIAGSSSNNQFTIPTTGTGYNYTVTTSEQTLTNQTGDCTLTWATPGTYTVEIAGDFPRIYFNGLGDKDKILEVQRWGNIVWTSFQKAFWGCSNLDVTATDSPNLSSVTDLGQCFAFCSSLNNSNGSIGDWNTSNISNMGLMFNNSSFNVDISSWDTSNVYNMSNMFSATPFNQPIDNWNTSDVLYMNSMFQSTPFNQNLNSWNVSSVVNMSVMFSGATAFNGNITSWNTSQVNNMSGMFQSTPFNQNIGGWTVSNVTDMSLMFSGASSFNQNLNSWNVSNVTDMSNMFGNATVFNGDITSWNVYKVTDMSYMFLYAYAFNQDISNWNVSSVTTMQDMFNKATSFNQDISKWNILQVTDMRSMFNSTTAFNQKLDFESYSAPTWATTGNIVDVSYGVVPSIPAYANQIIQFGSSASTTLNGYGFSIQVEFDANGDIATYSNITGSLYTIGDTITTDAPDGYDQFFNPVPGSSIEFTVTNITNAFKEGGVLMTRMFANEWASTGISTENYTDTVVNFANIVYNYGGWIDNEFSQLDGTPTPTFDNSRGGGANFASAAAARTYLTTTASWTMGGDNVIN
jgi:surface protein